MSAVEQQNPDVSLFFTDGWIVSRDKVLIAAKLNALPEEYFSRVLYYWEQDWFTTDITDAVSSVCYYPMSDHCLWLGQAGTITAKRRGEPSIVDKITDADRYGNLNRIRTIEDQVYVCGYGGQIYRGRPGAWVHMDHGVLVPRPNASSVDLLDVDGTGPDNIYVVGTNGAIFHYDGRKWRTVGSPTNLHLTRVRCVSRQEIYVCGFRGTFLHGDGTAWEDLGDPAIQDNFYGVEVFQGKVFLARNSGLLRTEGQALAPVELGLDKRATFHRLHANDGVLWSFGTDHLFWFDGVRWTEAIPPHNRP